MTKRPRKQLTFADRLQKTVDKYNKRQRDNAALFRREQIRQGKGPNEGIDLMGLLK